MGLNLPKAQRVVVYVLFAGGCLAGIAGAVRTYYTWLRTTSKDGDTEWGMYYVVVTSSVELFVGIVSLLKGERENAEKRNDTLVKKVGLIGFPGFYTS